VDKDFSNMFETFIGVLEGKNLKNVDDVLMYIQQLQREVEKKLSKKGNRFNFYVMSDQELTRVIMVMKQLNLKM
jgi:preprotein translocase subunit SecE